MVRFGSIHDSFWISQALKSLPLPIIRHEPNEDVLYKEDLTDRMMVGGEDSLHNCSMNFRAPAANV